MRGTGTSVRFGRLGLRASDVAYPSAALPVSADRAVRFRRIAITAPVTLGGDYPYPAFSGVAEGLPRLP